MTDFDENGTEIPAPAPETMSALVRAEIDGQIATARAFPRSQAAFAREARELVTMDEDMAAACIYSLLRGKGSNKQVITGPSARFAEIVSYAFGNSRSGGRVVDVGKDYITAQGVFHDLEKNVMVTIEVQRRITDKYGKRYNADMIGVTGNAAIAIAVRNAQMKGIPKALWLPLYEAARLTAVGDIKSLPTRRTAALAYFTKAGVTEDQVFAKLEVEGIEDVGLDELEIMTGWRTALKEGSVSVDAMFAPPEADTAKPGATTQGAAQGAADAIASRATSAAQAAVEQKDAGDVKRAKPWLAKLHTAEDQDALDNVYNDAMGDLPKGSPARDEVTLLYSARKEQIA